MAEFSIIDQYFKRASKSDVSLGIGDDSAIVTPAPSQQLVICTDTLVAGRHFPLDTTAHAIGWKSVAVNLSDLAAMGAKPHSILLALSLPQIDHAWLKEFSRGLYDCCDQFGVRLIGGDTTQSPHLTLSVTALGWIPNGLAVKRSGAQVGDLICVSGTVGDAAFALQHIGHPLQQRLDYPTPRCELGVQLKNLAHSMIDVSDGISSEIMHLCKQSKVGCNLYEDKLPIDPQFINVCEEFNIDSTTVAINGGEDYELLFTIAMEDFEKIKGNPNFTIIGHMTQESEGIHLVTRANTKIALKARGWDALT